MSPTMEKALEEIRKLPESEQETFAEWILAELASEQRWNELFAESEGLLAQLAAEALKEHQEGRTKPLNLDEL